jgi:hypothetical protein
MDRPVTWLHGLWVLVFAVDAARPNSETAHQLGAIALGLLFGALFVSELRSNRQKADSEISR